MVQYIGKLDKNKLGKYKNKIITEDVVLTDERIKHIKEHHPNDYEKYGNNISEILSNPDYIIDDNKNANTVLYMKTITKDNKNIQVVVRLATNQEKKGKKNSIITLWKIKDKTYNQMLRNKEIIWKKVDKNE